MPDNQMLFNINEASQMLNIKVSRLRTAIFRREIGHVKIGGLIRFSKQHLEAWISESEVLPR